MDDQTKYSEATEASISTCLLLSFYYFLSESHSNHFRSLLCSINRKQKVKQGIYPQGRLYVHPKERVQESLIVPESIMA